MPLMSKSEKSRYLHERLLPKGRFDPKSFRTKVSGNHRLVMGCPIGKYNNRTGQCKVSMQVQSLLHPKSEFQDTVNNIGKAIDKLERMLKRVHPAAVTKEIKRMLATYRRRRTLMKNHGSSNPVKYSENDIMCKNPELRNFGSYLPENAVEIYEKITAIEATKGGNRVSHFPNGRFRHEFDSPARIFGLEDGSLLVVSSDGKPLWNMFNYDSNDIKGYTKE